jgi:hypothetical protein
MAQCRVEMKVGKDAVVAGYKNVCVDAQIYKFVYSKKCSGA